MLLQPPPASVYSLPGVRPTARLLPALGSQLWGHWVLSQLGQLAVLIKSQVSKEESCKFGGNLEMGGINPKEDGMKCRVETY